MAHDAQIIFCPYNYVINPVIRRAMEVDIEGAIVILDEAQYVVVQCTLLAFQLMFLHILTLTSWHKTMLHRHYWLV